MIAPTPVHPDSIYDEPAIKFCLGISPAALAEGRRSGKLRFSRIGNRILYRGGWLMGWFDSLSDLDREGVVR